MEVITMNESEICGICGKAFPCKQLIKFEEQLFCPNCLENGTLVCARCGNRIWKGDNAGDRNTPLCQFCYERFYTSCADCGKIIMYDDAYYENEGIDELLCWSCFCRAQQDKEIHEDSYKPTPIFYGEGSRYFGVELEIDGAGEDSENACSIMCLANQDRELIYCKHDGRLTDGFEIVTHPMTLDFHQSSMPWREVLREAIDLGYKSHKSGTCGLHIHVNRSAFGDTEAQREACIARILYIVEKFWDELLKFSRRTQSQLNQRAVRYTSVNLQNLDTIEFRIFRGTLKYNTLIATLQLVDKICNMAIALSNEKLQALSWTSFVSGCSQLELVRYLKERRLYVNEPVFEGEEI